MRRLAAYLYVWWATGRLCRRPMLGCDCKVFRRSAIKRALQLRYQTRKG